MGISSLYFTDVGPFEEITLEFDDQVNVFTGPIIPKINRPMGVGGVVGLPVRCSGQIPSVRSRPVATEVFDNRACSRTPWGYPHST